ILTGGAFWFLSTQQEKLKGTVLEPIAEKLPDLSGREEIQVVLMLDGTTYYAEKLEHDGPVLRITGKNGGVVEVAEKDVLDITTAVLE
ncbi:MAG: hypothetical protein D3906_18120, partial [Candidatus Electrothrix sp. AUS1_2]|nr:hypothetical protein [Candidatus Electrothrix sp. AUS1_2]